MIHLLCFGNPYLDCDNLAIRIADSIIEDRIKGIEVVKCISPDEVLHYTDKEFFILDVVKGAEDVMLIDDIDRLKSGNLVTLHDFDLGFFLKLMKETEKIDKVRIIGIPLKGDIHAIKEKVLALVSGHSGKKKSESAGDFLLLGVGNTMRGDDGIGPYIAGRFDAEGWKVIDSGMVPENFTSLIRKAAPKTVVIIDSAEIGIKPGEFRIVPKERLGKLHLTTHAMPLSVLIGFIEEFVKEVIFIGIQPKELKMGDDVTEELKKAAEDLMGILKEKEFSRIKKLD